MRADSLARKIAKQLQRESQVVVKPDHPLLFDSPDLLIADAGSLVAAFILRASEHRTSGILFSRLAVTLLALPPNLRCVLLIPKDARTENNYQNAHAHFHEVLDAEDVLSLMSFTRDPQANGNIQAVPPEVKLSVFRRFELFLSESKQNLGEMINEQSLSRDKAIKKPVLNKPDTLAIKDEDSLGMLIPGEGYPFPESKALMIMDQLHYEHIFFSPMVKRWNYLDQSYSEEVSPTRLIRQDDTVVGALVDGRSSTTMEKIKPLCRDALRLSFVMDTGVPYLNQPTIDLLLTEHIPVKRFDPEKPIRAAAFV